MLWTFLLLNSADLHESMIVILKKHNDILPSEYHTSHVKTIIYGDVGSSRVNFKKNEDLSSKIILEQPI
jgi:bacillopeptidase F (M6 metalloprotease family)